MLNFLTQGITKFFGTKSDRDVKEIMPYVEKTKAEFAKLQNLSNDELRQKVDSARERIKKHLESIDTESKNLKESIELNPEMDVDQQQVVFKKIDALKVERNKALEVVLLEVLPVVFASVKETARRFTENETVSVTATALDRELATRKEYIKIEGDQAIYSTTWSVTGNPIKWNMVHYDVQLIGGVALHQGKISEMATGEGKTLVATLPAFLNAIAEQGVHIVTVNDYLAKRDSEWMTPIFEFNGVTCDCIDKYQPNTPERKKAYLSGITYGTNNEFGFDYLRDNMTHTPEELVQREHHYAMVDEVDSVLVDDARTPLIISGPMSRTNDEELYMSLKPRVGKIVEAQKKIVNEYLNEARRLIAAGSKKEGGLALFRAHRGFPKSKPLIKFLSETGNKQLLQETESIYLAENQKLMPQADAPLFFTIEEKNNSIEMTDKGLDFITAEGEDTTFFIMPDLSIELNAIEINTEITEHDRILQKDAVIQDYSIKAERIHAVSQLLKAYTLFEKEVEYVIMDGKVMIVDEQTGRIMDGRRWSDGLHQAVEAKENVKIEDSTQTYATVTLQNYFRMYHKLAGMTGTAETEAKEFWDIYKLDVVTIPTNKPATRKDNEDMVYKTVREKYNAVGEEIQKLVQQGRPVLVGTTSVENSEILSRLLKIRGVQHQVLNAKYHQREAEIVADAGNAGSVTIATNMAGRGTDIKLSSDSKISGGLAIIGTERHESRRVDRQLRGRSGRQGDPGTTQFFVSLEDSLMRMFGSDRIAKVMDRMGMEEGEVIQHSMVTSSLERAQRKVEENNFGTRKRLIEYDDVMNIQRETTYKRRKNALFGDQLSIDIADIQYDVCAELVNNANKNYDEFEIRCLSTLGMEPGISREDFGKSKPQQLIAQLDRNVEAHYKAKNEALRDQIMPTLKDIFKERGAVIENVVLPITDGKHGMQVVCDLKKAIATDGREVIKEIEKAIALGIIDQEWKEHLRDMDDLKQSVQSASYEQKDPLLIYKFESVNLFKKFLSRVNYDTLTFLMKAGIPVQEEIPTNAQSVSNRKDSPKLSTNRNDDEQPEEQPQRNVERQSPIKNIKIADRNQRVSVQYIDGTIKKDVKYKNVEEDVVSGKAVLID